MFAGTLVDFKLLQQFKMMLSCLMTCHIYIMNKEINKQINKTNTPKQRGETGDTTRPILAKKNTKPLLRNTQHTFLRGVVANTRVDDLWPAAHLLWPCPCRGAVLSALTAPAECFVSSSKAAATAAGMPRMRKRESSSRGKKKNYKGLDHKTDTQCGQYRASIKDSVHGVQCSRSTKASKT